MDEKEKEERLEDHVKYWNLVDKIRDISLDAVEDLSVGDIISVLDRIKTELLQQEVIILIEEGMKENTEDVEGEESEELKNFQQKVDGIVKMSPLIGSSVF